MKTSTHFSLIFIIVVCLLAFKVDAQRSPQLKQQVSLSEVEDVVASSRQNAYLAQSLAGYTLIDQRSKIQLGTLQIDLNRLGVPAWGKVALWGDSSFLLSTGEELLKVDPITKAIDTMLNLKFPEFIINYTTWPGNEDWILIATKTYPVKNGSIKFSTTVKGKEVYDDTKDCRFILLDAKTNTIIKAVATPYAVTVFADNETGRNVLAGTFDGDVIAIDETLSATVVFHAFDLPVHSLVQQQDIILSVPHIAPKFISSYGDGRIHLYNKATNQRKEITLANQQPFEHSDEVLKVLATNHIRRVFSLPKENSILVNYGFRGLLKIALPSLDTTHYPVPLVNEINFYCFNKDSSQLLSSTSHTNSIFGASGELEAYDLDRKKFLTAFKKPADNVKYLKMYKLFDVEGNYHILGFKKGSFSIDSLIIYSSNKTRPTFLISSSADFIVNEDGDLILEQGGKAIYGQLLLHKLDRDEYRFHVGYRPGPGDTIPTQIFTVKLDTRSLTEGTLPYGVSAIFDMNHKAKLVVGTYPLNKRTMSWIRVLDSANKLIFSVPDFEYESAEFYKVSPSKSLVSFYYGKGGKDVLETWNVFTNKKIFSKHFIGNADLRFFTFDRNNDVLWYAQGSRDTPDEIFKVDLSAPVAKEQFAFAGYGFLEFAVDMDRDLIGSERLDELRLHRLSTQQLLRKVTPMSSYFSVFNQPDGFGFASETEYHTIAYNKSHLLFTSFDGFKPVEILNENIYKGEKSAINNLAFVLNRKAYMPGDYDIYFNRPDSVLKSSGSTNHAFNRLIATTVEKRKKYRSANKLEDILDNSPRLSVKELGSVGDVLNTNELRLTVQTGSPHGKPVTTLHVIDNDVPVFGSKGLKIPATKTENETTVIIPLSKDMNSLQLYASDKDGLVSYAENINVLADFVAPKAKTYFIGIGINQFAESGHNLNWSVKDIRDLATNLKIQNDGDVIIDTLFDKNVTIQNIMQLKKQLQTSGIEDKVIIAYSGHGLLSKEYDYYLSTYNVNFENPEKGGLPYDALENLLDSIPARKKLMLIDACHSGEVDKEEMQKYRRVMNDKTKEGLKGGAVENMDSTATVGMKNSFELMQELFVNVGRSTGATIISAASGTQLAQESRDLKNGVFTYSILEYMKDHPTATVSELKAYVNKRVPELTDGLQVPTTRTETKTVDWKLW